MAIYCIYLWQGRDAPPDCGASSTSSVSRGIRGADALNEVLFRALRKEPSARFPDMLLWRRVSICFKSLGLLSKGPEHSRALARTSSRCAGSVPHRWLDSTLKSLSDPTIDLPICGLRFPTASLTFGSAASQYGLFRIACTREDAQCSLWREPGLIAHT